MCIQLVHSAVQQKLTERCEPTTLQQKDFFKKEGVHGTVYAEDPKSPSLASSLCKLHFVASALIYGEGSGNPLQYSCLENPKDGGAWWAAVHGVAKSRT